MFKFIDVCNLYCMDYKLSRRNFLKATVGLMTGNFFSKSKEKSSIDVYAKEWEIIDVGENFEYAYKMVGDGFDPRVNFKNNMKKLLPKMLPEEFQEYAGDITEGGLKRSVLLEIVKRYGMGEVYGEISDFFDIFNELSEYDRTQQADKIDAYLGKMTFVDSELNMVTKHLRPDEPYISQEANTIISLLKEEKEAKDSKTIKHIYERQKEHMEHLKILLNHANKKGGELIFPKYRCVIGDYSIENNFFMVFLRFLGICKDATEKLYPMKKLSELGLKIIDAHEKIIEENLKILES